MNFPHTILYHGNCIDGWFSAYFAYTSIGLTNNVQMFPISPGQMNTWPNVKQMAGTHVLLLDVSVAEIHRTNWMENGALSVNCIDHHSSSIEHWAHDACPINVESCAAMQTFRHFYPEHPVPFWLEMIDRIDRWDNVTYEDRCIREILTIISHKPVQRKLDEAFMLTQQFIMHMTNPLNMEMYLAQGKQILDKKDVELSAILLKGGIHTFTHDYITGWKLPESWLSTNVYIIDNTNIVFDTTEASHIIFMNNPNVSIFINYRKKTFYTKDPKPVKKTMYVYSARSRGVNLTEGTIFNGHPSAAGASIIKEDNSVFLPFLLNLDK